ncbi:MAG: hypothetical protein GTO03_11590 [Planctomycetales bacterium]|nr:hypothetical protein [Planctomycetales bacterium]
MIPVRDSKLAGLKRRNARVAVSNRGRSSVGKRARGMPRNERLPFSPPEDWYEPEELVKRGPYDVRIVEQPAGKGFRHVVTVQDIRQRLEQLPASFVAPLEVVQLSRMTPKKERFGCYGMQWGSTVYLYPLEMDRIENRNRPPKPAQIQEAEMYGGRWVQRSPHRWQLCWTEQAARDFYLNNILIHEIGHLLDERNSGYLDRERYAEWFAVEHGYKPTRATRRRRPRRRRHHKT